MSQPMFISATTGTGMVPMIKLDPVSTPLADGTQQTIDLSARAFDPDGKVIEVRFYGNGELLE